MNKVFSLILVITLFLLPLCPTVSAEEYSAVEYILDNVDDLSDVYALLKPNSGDIFEGKFAELMIPVTIISTDLPGVYIDFDDDNGYMIIQDDSDVIMWEAVGDLEYLKNVDHAYYSIVDGFLYSDGGSFVPYEARMFETQDAILCSPYSGQKQAGDGTIYNEYLYVKDRYAGYEFQDSEYLNSPYEYMDQDKFSVYRSVADDGTPYSEGNCVLSSVYSLLNYLGFSRKCDFPSSDRKIVHDPADDPFYNSYANNPRYQIESPAELPALYYCVRYWAIEDYGYQTSGFETVNIPGLIETVSEIYYNDVDATLHTLGSFESCVVSGMEDDNPVILCVSGSSTYGTHAIVVTGYRIYRKTTTILGINFYDYVYLLRVDDNWGGEERYFDFTAFNGTWGYVTVEVND